MDSLCWCLRGGGERTNSFQGLCVEVTPIKKQDLEESGPWVAFVEGLQL